MKRTYSLTPAGSVLAVAALVAACGGGSNGTGSGTGTGVSTGTGTLSLSLTDAPACGYDKVFVTIEKVRVHQSSSAGDNDAGWSEVALVAPQRVDLLTLNNGTLLPLGQTELPAGTYTQMRLVLAPNTAASPLANAIMPTGGAETALTLVSPIACAGSTAADGRDRACRAAQGGRFGPCGRPEARRAPGREDSAVHPGPRRAHHPARVPARGASRRRGGHGATAGFRARQRPRR